MNLSEQQRRAVERTGQDVCVVAGPGSGKTRVLIERFAWLVEQRGVDPTRILAITFTEKAATEIKQRLIDRFSGRPDFRESIERAWVSTIDGFCTRVLRENAIAAGLSPDFTILEQATAERLARDSAEQALEDLFHERPEEMRSLLEAIDLATQDDARQPDLAASLLVVYDAMRLSGVTEIPPRANVVDLHAEARTLASSLVATPARGTDGPGLREWATQFLALPLKPVGREHFDLLGRFSFHLGRVGKHPAASPLKNEILPRLEAQWLAEWYADLHSLLRLALSRIDAAYRERKRQESAVDFADLEEHTVRLLESDESIRRAVVGRFDEVLMDELQDTNRLQWRLIDLVRTNFFGVGDINQSIYGFRHADPEVFAEYRGALRLSGAVIDELLENYRSRPEILATVSEMLDGENGIEPRPLIAKTEFAPVAEPVVELLVGRGEEAADDEASQVAVRVLQLRDGGFEYSDIAVLVRTLSSTAPFERAFDRSGIPFLLSGGGGFLEARETRDLLALLAALVNPLDEIALITLLRSPLVGIADEDIFRIGREGWRELFRDRFGSLRNLAGFIAPDRLIATALDDCGYLTDLPERSRANVEKLLAWLRREFRNRPRPLAELLDDLEALRFTRSEAEAPPPEASDAVRMMSIHAAKGLEFPVVFVSAIHRGPDRRKPVIAFTGESGLGVRWRHPVTGKGKSDAIHSALAAQIKSNDEAEENRLLYVAMTRAEQRLILSYAERKNASAWQKLADRVLSPSDQPIMLPSADREVRSSTPPAEQILMPPAISGQYDSATAVTSVAMFHACPRKYYLARYLGLEQHTEVPGTGAIELGLAVHAALAGETLAGQTIDSAEAIELADRFRSSDLGRRAAAATHIEREFDFMFEVDDIVLRGQIDLWFEHARELILVDYKTDRDESSATTGYALQLSLYAMALERYAGRRPDHAVLYYLRSDRAVEITMDSSSARKAVLEFRQAQENLEFPLRIGEQCGRCGFWGGLCPAGRDGEVRPGFVSLRPSSSQGPAKVDF